MEIWRGREEAAGRNVDAAVEGREGREGRAGRTAGGRASEASQSEAKGGR